MDLSSFDAEELLHLAIDLTGRQQHAEALSCLKRAATLEPTHAGVVYFTGVIYVQTGLAERALQSFQHAVQLNPDLHLAHFQLGLLFYTSEREAQAIDAWRPLDRLGEAHPLYLFKAGLEALERQEFDACRDFLNKGIAVDPQSGPFNEAMRGFLAWTDEEERDAQAESQVPDMVVRLPAAPQRRDLPLPPMFRARDA